MIIYKAKCKINGKVYIGLTISKLSERKAKHKYDAFVLNKDGLFQRALRKYGFENFQWRKIDKAETFEELCEKEKYWISKYRSYIGFDDCNGYNSTLGGEGQLKHSQGYSQWLKDTRAEKRAKRREENAILVYDVEGDFKGQYGSHRECADNVDGLYVGHISSLLNGKRHVLNGYIAIYKREFTEDLLKEKLDKANRVGKGSMASQAKLTESDVITIKKLLMAGINSPLSIAKRFNISRSLIYGIKRNEKWTHVEVDGWDEWVAS